MRLRIISLALLAMFFWLSVAAQPVCRITSYYDTSNHDPLHHVCGILQDAKGMIWIASWGGMFTFDGTRFTAHDEQLTKSRGITPGMERGIEPCPTGDNWCLMGKAKDAYITDSYGTTWHIDMSGRLLYRDRDGKEMVYSSIAPFEGYRGCFADKQGNWWVVCYYAIHKLEFCRQRLVPIAECEGMPLRCMSKHADGSYWLCQRRHPRVLIYNPDHSLKGYLTKDGRIVKQPTDFFAPVYSILTGVDKTVWVGTRGAGAYRLTPVGEGGYRIEKIRPDGGAIENGACDDIYSIKRDRYGRVWLATLYGGILMVTQQAQATDAIKAQQLAGYSYRDFPRARSLDILNDTLVIGTSEGLVVADISPRKAADIKFRTHRYTTGEATGLSSNLVDDVMFDRKGRLLVCTENGGLNISKSESLFEKNLRFEHIDNSSGLSDIAFAVTEDEKGYWVTSMYSLSYITWDMATHRMEVSRFGQNFFGGRFRLDEIPPLMLSKDLWIISTDMGPMRIVSPGDMMSIGYKPAIVLTKLSIGNTETKYTNIPERITLNADQRSFRIEFAALDYTNPNGINYYYRIADMDSTWISLGNNNMLSFADIAPGTHSLEICSTNGQGQWTDNTLTIQMEVEPRFTETIWAIILLIVVSIMCGWAVIYTIMYIRRINKKHNEMLAAYLSVIGKRDDTISAMQSDIQPEDSEDDFIERLTDYIGQNISNPDLRTDMMADHMGVSISTLTRTTKLNMGVTLGEFLAKARIKRAETVLTQQKHLSISEVAYKCGFNDPKYFSRCFKNETKMSPTEYRNQTSTITSSSE